MHQRSISELQGAPTQQGASIPRITCDRTSRWRRGCGWLRCPGRRAPLWAWLLLGALVVPGAWSFLNEEQEELLVELHNYYRGQVSPSASAMMPLKWDPNLKVIAEGYAAKCVWNHNPELEDTGENLFAGTGPLDLRVAVEKWFLEHLDYDFHNNSCDEEKMCGHYTQMVWADTHRVGCAFHLCNSMEGLDWERVSFLVCNYFPAGNFEGFRPYVEGDWCSRCPENLQQCENNLCGAEREEEEEVQVEEEKGEQEVQEEVTTEPSVQTPHIIFVDVNELTVQPTDTPTVSPTVSPTASPTVPHTVPNTVPNTVPHTVPQTSSEEEEEDTPPPATPETPSATLEAEEEEDKGEVEEEEKKKVEGKVEDKRTESSEKVGETIRAVPPKISRVPAAGSRCSSTVLVAAPALLLLLRM